MLELFKKHPSLAVKLFTSSVFLFVGSLTLAGILDLHSTQSTQYLFGGLLFVYGAYRLFTFWLQLNDIKSGKI